jgi:hypothetical protein
VVTKQAGILNSHIGYGLGVGVSDLDLDGDLDIYVSNDFNENDYLYINQGNGSFKQALEQSIPHSSRFSMGNDIADVNNDGMADIITLDMLPNKESVIKTTAGEDAYEIYAFKLRYGYHYQVARNALQLNRGVDSTGMLSFSDIAPLAGVEATDWSWAPLLADFDNDGYRDLFVANGILGRPNDLDYINFISTDSAQQYFSDQQLFEQMPPGNVENMFFKNRGDRTFQDVSSSWTNDGPGFSNGAAYGDLDNDGDLDLVVNNINEPAAIYRNELSREPAYVSIKFDGNSPNTFGIGARVTLYRGRDIIVAEQIPTRGWLSAVEPKLHFGLGSAGSIDSLVVDWPDGRSQHLRNVTANRELVLHQSEATNNVNHKKKWRSLLKTAELPGFRHAEDDFVAFNIERLIPHMLSTEGPRLAVGDVNGDGLDDFFVGGAAKQPAAVFVQDMKGSMHQTIQPSLWADSLAEDIGVTLFDANGDGSLDLVVAGGGQQYKLESPHLIPRLYINDGTGTFVRSKGMPSVNVNASCVRAGDIDGDGDIDLFIGGRVVPGYYGLDPRSYILLNDGQGVFTDQTEHYLDGAGGDSHLIGMVSDAWWCDLNGDKLLDLVVVGEWMPITIFIHHHSSGRLINETETYGLSKTNGWWNTVLAHDFDGDGDLDLVAGNMGMNSRLRPTLLEPVSLYVGDIDDNNSMDQILTYYNDGEPYPLISRDQLVKQIPSLRRRFLKYANYANVSLDDIVPPNIQSRFVRKDAYMFYSAYFENKDGKFFITALPSDAQLFPIYSFCKDDVDGDGNIDLLAVGNLDAVQPEFGRYDAGRGLLLKGSGNGTFEPIDANVSGFCVRGQGRDVNVMRAAGGRRYYVVSRNNDSLLLFR